MALPHQNGLFMMFMQFWIMLLLTLLPLGPSCAKTPPAALPTEISSQELKAAEELLFKTECLQKLLTGLKKDNVRWFFTNYRDGDKVVFELRDKREDLDHYPFISRFAVNPQTKECFEQRGDYEKIH